MIPKKKISILLSSAIDGGIFPDIHQFIASGLLILIGQLVAFASSLTFQPQHFVERVKTTLLLFAVSAIRLKQCSTVESSMTAPCLKNASTSINIQTDPVLSFCKLIKKQIRKQKLANFAQWKLSFVESNLFPTGDSYSVETLSSVRTTLRNWYIRSIPVPDKLDNAAGTRWRAPHLSPLWFAPRFLTLVGRLLQELDRPTADWARRLSVRVIHILASHHRPRSGPRERILYSLGHWLWYLAVVWAY